MRALHESKKCIIQTSVDGDFYTDCKMCFFFSHLHNFWDRKTKYNIDEHQGVWVMGSVISWSPSK